MIDIVDELLCIDRTGLPGNRRLSRDDGHSVCQRGAAEIQRLRDLLAERDQVHVPDAGKSGLPNCRAGLDDLSRELLALLSEIQTAAFMASVLADDPADGQAWKMIRDKAASGAELYRQAKYPPRGADQAGDLA